MAKNLRQVLNQIASLQKEADALRAKEVSGVIERIREAIAAYGLTPEALFGDAAPKRRGRKPGAKNIKKAPAKSPGGRASRSPGVAKYRDPASGKTWTGVGKRPAWFIKATEGGNSADELLIK